MNEDSEQVYTISSNSLEVPSTCIRVMIYSSTNTVLPNGSGIIAILQFTVKSGVVFGQSCNLTLSGVKLSDSQSNPISASLTDGTFNAPQLQLLE